MTPGVKRLSAELSVLVLIDVQDKLLVKIPTAASLIRNAGFLLDVAGLLSIPVRATEQYPKGLGPTTGELIRRLAQPPLAKSAFSCCARRDLSGRTRDVTSAKRRARWNGDARLCSPDGSRSLESGPSRFLASRCTGRAWRGGPRHRSPPGSNRPARCPPPLRPSLSSGSRTQPTHSSRP